MSEIGHNGVAAEELLSFVERLEAHDATIADENSLKAEIFKEARGRGYDLKALRRILSTRRMDPDKRAEQDAIFELYAEALGIDP